MIIKVAKIVSIACLSTVSVSTLCCQQLERFVKTEPHLGTLVSLTAHCEDQVQFDAVAGAFFHELERLNAILSDYDAESEVSKINADHKKKSVAISRELSILLQRSCQMTDMTEGVMDPTLGRLTHLWKRAFARNKIPSRRSIRRALRHAGHDLMRVDTLAHNLFFEDPCVQLDLGAVGKGYIGDLLSSFLKAKGIPIHLIDLGGDLVAGSAPPDTEGWQIALVDGSRQSLAHQAIATSGTSYQFLEHKGERYSHLIDARTGYGLAVPTVSTVIAKDGLTADAIASTLPFLSEEKRNQLAEQLNFTYKISSHTLPDK